MKKLVSVVAMLMLVVGLCACGSNEEQSGAQEASSGQDVLNEETLEAEEVGEVETNTVETESTETTDGEVVENGATQQEVTTNTQLGLYNMFYAIAEFNLPEDFSGIDWPYVDAAEVDYTYMFGDEETEEFYGYICFEMPNFTIESASEKWHGMTDAVVEEIDHAVFDYHLFGEDETHYYEAYIISEKHPETGRDVWHGVTMEVDVTTGHKEKVVQDYHAIIDSMSIRYCTEDECLEVIYGE